MSAVAIVELKSEAYKLQEKVKLLEAILIRHLEEDHGIVFKDNKKAPDAATPEA